MLLGTATTDVEQQPPDAADSTAVHVTCGLLLLRDAGLPVTGVAHKPANVAHSPGDVAPPLLLPAAAVAPLNCRHSCARPVPLLPLPLTPLPAVVTPLLLSLLLLFTASREGLSAKPLMTSCRQPRPRASVTFSCRPARLRPPSSPSNRCADTRLGVMLHSLPACGFEQGRMGCVHGGL